MRYKPSKNELFAKKSTLALQIDEDDELGFGGYIYDRKSKLIVSDFKVRVNTITKIDDLEIPKKQKKKEKEGQP